MTSIDDLFKKPNLPTGSLKRKLEAPDAQQAYKASKLSNGSPSQNGKTNGATVEDAAEEDDDDMEAGPSLPPEDEDEDEEGRFFGGGVSRDAADALDYLNEQDGEEEFREEKIDSAWLKRLLNSFEKKVNKNAELRARYEDEPAKFMASEADLDAEVKSWSLLSDHPELYSEFAASAEGVGSVVGLLAHENTDIAIGAIEILAELLDEDVQAEQDQWDALASALLDADLLDLLMSNFKRLDESEEADRNGVYHSLAVLESLASQRSVAEGIGTTTLLSWLCARIARPEKPVGQNKQYSAEVLQVLLQTSPVLRQRLAGSQEIDGVELFLQLLSAYRKRDPEKDSTEEEFAENVFDSLTCVLDESEGKKKFVEAEGVELALIMLKEGGFSKIRALRALDHAVGGNSEAAMEVCLKLVEAGGLKNVFSLFAKLGKEKSSTSAGDGASTTEHLLGIFSALLRLLPGESAERIRLLAKFTEKEHAKVGKLCGLRQDFARKLKPVQEEIALEKRMLDPDDADVRAEREDEWFSRRLEGGLFGLQMVDTILAWLVAEDAGAKEAVRGQVGGLGEVRASLEEMMNEADDGDENKEMLEALIGFLGE